MKFIVVTIEWMSAHGLTPLPTMRKSKDGSKVILHEDYFNLVAKRDEEGKLILESAEVYAHNSEELQNLLNSDEWSYSEEEAPTESTDFIQVAAVRNLMTATKAGIQTMNLTDGESLEVKDMYPEWSEFINKSLSQGMKVRYNDALYRVRQDISVVLDTQFPSIYTAALYEEINEEHSGTVEDPIPYNNNMALVEGKYYSQNNVTYLCTRSTGQAVYNNLSDLVGIYVEEISTLKI